MFARLNLHIGAALNCCPPLRLPLEGAARRTEGILLKNKYSALRHTSSVSQARHLLLKDKANIAVSSAVLLNAANEIRHKKNVDIRESKSNTDVAVQIDIIPQGYIFGKNVCFWSSYPLLNELCRCKRSSVFCARLRLRIFCFKRFSIIDRTPKLHEPVQYSCFCFKAKFKNNFKTYEPILRNSVFIHERVFHKGEVRPEERLKNEFRRQKNETETQKRIIIAALHDNGIRSGDSVNCCRTQ